jgi:AraC-like DNA-binding protein
MDVLTDLLQRSRARGAAFSHSTMRGAWGVAFGTVPGLAVHAIVDGEIHLWADDPDTSTRLLPGDIVLVRGDVEHRMAHAPGAACEPMEALLDDAKHALPTHRLTSGNGAGPPAVFFCGAYMFEGDLCAGLLAALPDTVHLRPGAGSPLRATMDLLAGELLHDAPGQQALLDRLLDVALVQVLREHFTANRAAAPPWFRAMNDPAIGPALRELHADPGRRWTVAELAERAALSRATFARRFTELLGVGPLAYLTDWRMALARERLRDTDDRLAAIAGSLGYSSEFAFAAAFKRHEGVAPGRWRVQAQRVTPGPPARPRPDRARTAPPTPTARAPSAGPSSRDRSARRPRATRRARRA